MKEGSNITPRFRTVLDGAIEVPVISQVKSAGNLVVSDGEPIMMISVLSIFSFIKLELSHVFIYCRQTEN